jgi:hypothetical protein
MYSKGNPCCGIILIRPKEKNGNYNGRRSALRTDHPIGETGEIKGRRGYLSVQF